MLIQVHCTSLGPEAGWVCVDVEPTDKIADVIEQCVRKKEIQRIASLSIFGENGLALSPDTTIAASGLGDGASLYIGSSRDNRSFFTFEKRWWVFLALLSLLVGLSGLVWAPTIFFLPQTIPFDYGVVIDAGSSGSRVSLYQWVGNKYNGTGLVNQIDICKMQPGLSSQNATYATVNDYLSNCMVKIRDAVPKEERPTTPVYLAATAGMRLLQILNPEKAEMLLEASRFSLAASGLLLVKSEIITGHEEGTAGWITVNFLKGVLHDGRPDGMLFGSPDESDRTFGAMDLGGASTQITFEVDPMAVIVEPRDEEHLKLYGRPYRIFSHSYLCFGINEAYRRYLAYLVLSSDNSTVVDDPCGNVGRVREEKLSNIFGSPCTAPLKPDALKIGPENTLTLNGAWDESACTSAVDRLFSWDDCVKVFDSKLCFNASVVPPRIEGTHLAAFSVFHHLYKAFGFDEPTVSQDAFHEAVLSLCNMAEQEMIVNISGRVNMRTDILNILCFEAVFVDKLLVEQYKITGPEFERIEFMKQIPDAKNGTDIGWSLGYMINATNALPEDHPDRPISALLFAFLVFVFVGLTATGAFLAYHAWILSRRRRRYEDYQRLDDADDN